jgi:Plasmid stabilization system protein
MGLVRKREAAKRDLVEQWVWYAENASIKTADRFLAAADSTATLLARQPESGSRVSTTRVEFQEIRRFPLSDGFERISLFYFPLPDGIDLVRVIHASRDLQRLLGEEVSE